MMKNEPVLIVYPGYANDTHLIVMGHLFKKKPRRWFPSSAYWWKNVLTMISIFRTEGVANAKIRLNFNRIKVFTNTDSKGFFRFEVRHELPLDIGYHQFMVSWILDSGSANIPVHDNVTGKLIKPSEQGLAIITDVDDTLIISHSRSLARKMFTLLTQTPQQRLIFADTVRHYTSLNQSFEKFSEGISFFAYLSSSEWNLYPFILEFCNINRLPKGVFLLRTLKTNLSDFLRTGRGNHAHKLRKIAKLIRFYQNKSFVLLGDDNQKDPEIYGRIANLYPDRIACIYIRNARRKKRKSISKLLTGLSDSGIPSFYYRHSAEAIAHSVKIGLIDKTALNKNPET
jgi:phosphatidate phosphatase APP1